MINPCKYCGCPVHNTRTTADESGRRDCVQCPSPTCPEGGRWFTLAEWNRRARITVAQALTVPEVRALVEWAYRVANGYIGGQAMVKVVLPFLPDLAALYVGKEAKR